MTLDGSGGPSRNTGVAGGGPGAGAASGSGSAAGSTPASGWERVLSTPRASAAGHEHGRVPPSDVDAERAVLSALMLDNDALHAVVTELKPHDFYHPAHQTLFRVMVELKDQSQPVDLTTLADALRSRNQLEAVGGAVALAEISDYEATAANVLHYARIVAEKATKRSLISVASEIVAMGYEHGEEADAMLDAAESKIFALSQEKAKSTLSSLAVEMHDAVDYIDMLMNRSGDLTGVPTGFAALDRETGGFQPGDLIIVAARPSMGKTAFALNVARNAAVDAGRRIAVFSLEMTTRSLVLRLLSAEAQVDFSTFRSGLFSTEAHARLMTAASRMAEAGIWIDDSGAATVLEIRAKARRLHAQQGLDMVIVDYLQLAHGSKNLSSREQEISEISRGLKGLAKELDIPVIALSQLNRGPETRKEDKRPMLADLRESGAIEQDADIIAFIYRDVVYNKETEHENLAELIIAKQRNGPTGTVNLEFEGRYARFKDWAVSGDPFAGAPGSGGFDAGALDASAFGGGDFDDESPF